MVNLSAMVFCLVSGLVLSLSGLESPSNYHETPHLAAYSTISSSQMIQNIPMGGMRIIIPDAGFPYVLGDSTGDVEVPGDVNEDDGNDEGEDLPPGADVNDNLSGGTSDILIEV